MVTAPFVQGHLKKAIKKIMNVIFNSDCNELNHSVEVDGTAQFSYTMTKIPFKKVMKITLGAFFVCVILYATQYFFLTFCQFKGIVSRKSDMRFLESF
jgi:hypothetical protein